MLQVISLLVENKPGALMRITGLLSQLSIADLIEPTETSADTALAGGLVSIAR